MLIFDLESDGLLDDLTKIHCMVIQEGTERTRYRPHEVHIGVQRLLDAVQRGVPICGHNIINFDIPAINKVFPWFSIERSQRIFVLDTLVLSRLIYGNIKDRDSGLLRKGILPGKLFGSHSLRAWGYRLGELKGDFALHTEADVDKWAIFTEDMMDYNEQDVVVTAKLVALLLSKEYPPQPITLEHEAAWLIAQQERNGFPFDIQKAQELEVTLRGRAAVLAAKLQKEVPPIPDKTFIPKRNNKTKGYIAGVPVKRFKDFNPNSRQQIEWIITKHYGYLPPNEELYNFSDGDERRSAEKMQAALAGQIPLKVDEPTFKHLKDDEECPDDLRKLAAIFEEYLMVSKRLGQLADGSQAWLKHVKVDGKIHGSVNPCGAVTGRATHSHPNVAQVPKCGSPYGQECRELFTVPEGWVQAGVDASGLELRCLGHFMAPYDNGQYAHTVVHGDIHTLNQEAAGLPTRDNAKTFIYAFLYGAGDAKIGKIVKGDNKDGKRLKRSFLKKTPAISDLKAAIIHSLVLASDRGKVLKWKRKWLKGLDGRPLHVRSLHSALNLLLQSAGALICKKWIIRTEERLIERGLQHDWDGDFAFMAWVHDEFQCACRSQEIAEIVIAEAQEAMRDTQAFFDFRVQLDTDGKTGENWSECH